MTQRVFVLGLQRSGTTWLANMLANLPQVAAVAHAEHQGVHESVFFSHFARNFGSWDDAQARTRFADAFAASDYFRLMGLPHATLERAMAQGDSFGAVFAAVMDAYAQAQGADIWIEKSPHHTVMAEAILQAVPDARFIMVERSLSDLVASRLHGFGRTPKAGFKFWKDVLRGAVTAAYYRREMRLLARRDCAMLVSYNALKSDPGGRTRASIIDFLSLDADPDALRSTYRANSSFKGAKPVALSVLARGLVQVIGVATWVPPLAVLRRAQQRRTEARGADWPDWVWSQTGYRPPANS